MTPMQEQGDLLVYKVLVYEVKTIRIEKPSPETFFSNTNHAWQLFNF